MLDAEDSVELRALQARAYGRSGALSAAEAERLHELESARVPEDGLAASTSPGPSEPAQREPAQREPADVVATGPGPHDVSALTVLRRRWPVVLGVSVVFVVVGVLLGWLLFADRGPGPLQLTTTQQDWQAAIIASGDFDLGSIRALQEEEGVVIWFATKEGGANVCLVLGDDRATAPACTTREQASIQGVNATLTTVVDESQSYDVEVQMLLTPDGEPAVIVRSYITSPQTNATFASQEEVQAAEALAEATGLDHRSIAVVGYDAGVPIWTGIDMETQRFCLVFDGSMPDPPMVCDDTLMLSGAESTLALDVEDAGGVATRYEYRFGYGQQYLTVTKGEAGDDAAGE